MASAGSVFVDLLLRDSQYASGWQKARNTTRQNTSQIRGDVNQLGKAFDGVLDPVNNISNSIKSLGAAIAGALSVQKVIQYSDTWKQLSGRLLIVEGSLENLTKTQQDLFEIAQRNRQPLESVLSFYSRLKQFIPETERAQYDLLGVTESVTAALAITGETSQAASGALIQFTQAIGTNFEAAGQELRSLQEQAPRLTQALMKALGDGTKSLQQLKNEGKLTRESVLNALSGTGEEGKRLADELAKVPITVAQAFTQLDNAFLKYIGQSKSVASGTSSLVVGIQALAANLDLVASAIVLTSSVLVARLIPGLAANAAAFVSSTLQSISYQNALIKLNGVQSQNIVLTNATRLAAINAATGVTSLNVAASRATVVMAGLNRALALVGGPLGAAFLAVGAAIYYFANATTQAERAAVLYAEQIERVRDRAVVTSQEINGVTVAIEDMSNTIAKTEELSKLKKQLDDASESAKRLRFDLEYDGYKLGFNGFAASIQELKIRITDPELYRAFDESRENFKATGDVEAYEAALNSLAANFPESGFMRIRDAILGITGAILGAEEATIDLSSQIYNLSGNGPPIPGRKPSAPQSFSSGTIGSGSASSTREKVDSIDKFLTKQRELLKTLQQEADYIGLTSVEITKLKDARDFDTKVAEKSLGLKGQELIKFREQTDAIRQLRQEAIETNYELSRSAETGITEFFKKYQEDATNAAKNVQSVLETAFKGAEDAFVEFAKTGKFSFKDFANSILEDIIRIQFRAQAAKLSGALSEIAGSIFGAIGGSAFGGATSSVNYSVQGGLNLKNLPMYADGGYIGPGQYGIAGEAGAELIYGGKTGATVIPQTGGNVVNIINNTPSQVSTRSGTNGASIDVVIDQAVASALSRPGSLTNQALQNQQSRGLTRR